MKRRVSALSALLLIAAASPLPAWAQYKWVDESGQVVYSDRPPSNPRLPVKLMRGSVIVPVNNNASAPLPASGTPSDAATPTGAEASSGDKGASAEKSAADKANGADRPGTARAGKDQAKDAAAPMSLADKDLAFKRRQQERADAERKQAEQSQKAAQLAKLCEDRRTDLRTLESGARISRVETNGERTFMTDDEIAKRRETLQKGLSDDCRRG